MHRGGLCARRHNTVLLQSLRNLSTAHTNARAALCVSPAACCAALQRPRDNHRPHRLCSRPCRRTAYLSARPATCRYQRQRSADRRAHAAPRRPAMRAPPCRPATTWRRAPSRRTARTSSWTTSSARSPASRWGLLPGAAGPRSAGGRLSAPLVPKWSPDWPARRHGPAREGRPEVASTRAG